MPCLVAGSKPASQLFLNISHQTCETPVRIFHLLFGYSSYSPMSCPLKSSDGLSNCLVCLPAWFTATGVPFLNRLVLCDDLVELLFCHFHRVQDWTLSVRPWQSSMVGPKSQPLISVASDFATRIAGDGQQADHPQPDCSRRKRALLRRMTSREAWPSLHHLCKPAICSTSAEQL